MKNKIIIFLVLASFNGFSQITRTLSNVTNTADSMKPLSVYQKASIVQKLHTVATISALQGFTDATIATFDGSQWNKKSGNVASNGGTYGGTIINVNASFYWERKIEKDVLPEYFGADPNNADNTTMIQSAIDYAIANNLPIRLPKRKNGTLGLYKITAPLVISGSISISGDGINYSGLLCINTHGFVINAGVNNVRIQSLNIIQQTRYTTTTNGYMAIQTLGTTSSQNYWHIYRDLFIDGFKWALQSPNTWSTSYDTIIAVYCGGGINAPGQSVNNFVSHCQFSGGNNSGSVGIQIGDGTIVTEGWGVTDCLISNFEVGIWLYGASNVTIRGCIIDFFSLRGILLQSNSIGATMNCTISENYLACQGTGATGIWLLNNYGASASQNRGNTITNNQVLFYSGSTLSYGIYISGTAETKNMITGNRIVASTFDIRLTTGDDSFVGFNNFKGAGFYTDILVNYYGNTGIIQNSAASLFQSNGKTRIYYNSVIPTAGTYQIADIIYNISPASTGYVGWVCTVAGTPGTWKGFGLIQ